MLLFRDADAHIVADDCCSDTTTTAEEDVIRRRQKLLLLTTARRRVVVASALPREDLLTAAFDFIFFIVNLVGVLLLGEVGGWKWRWASPSF